MSERKRILIVDDERDLVELLALNLGRAGYETRAAYDGRQALTAIASEVPDLVILDVMMPELSGTEVASRIRMNPATASLPIVMLTARAEEVDEIVGLTVGADDYLTKPFSVKVLLARIEAVLRRSGGELQEDHVLRAGGVEIHPETHRVFVEGVEVKLTLTEYRLLAALVEASGRVLSREALMRRAMGPGVLVTQRTIDVHVTALRKKLGVCGGLIETVRGVGYRVAPSDVARGAAASGVAPA